MKIRTDFVTNSSSVSYVLMYKKYFSFETFAKKIGLRKGSLLEPIYKSVYKELYERVLENNSICNGTSNNPKNFAETIAFFDNHPVISKNRYGYSKEILINEFENGNSGFCFCDLWYAGEEFAEHYLTEIMNELKDLIVVLYNE